jgi:glycosyltransferase involved in cell wall biosynthesis
MISPNRGYDTGANMHLNISKKKTAYPSTSSPRGYSLNVICRFILVYISVLLFQKKNSIIVFQKIRTNRIYAAALKLLLYLRPENTIYDIDDPDYLTFNKKTINHFIQNAEKCTVGSAALYDYASKLNPNSFLLTSPVIYHNETRNNTNTIFTIGWIGYYNAHRNSLKELLFPALSNHNFDIRLVLLGVSNSKDILEIQAMFANSPNITLDIPIGINWLDEMSVYKRICTFDIGVSPLLNTDVNQAKSAFKLKQCLSCGVPVLASPVGENNSFIKNGVNGYFCIDSSEFRMKIITMKELHVNAYNDMAKNALETTNEFNMNLYTNNLTGLFYR